MCSQRISYLSVTLGMTQWHLGVRDLTSSKYKHVLYFRIRNRLGKPSKKKKIVWKFSTRGGGSSPINTFLKKTKLVLKCVLSHFKPF